MRYHNMLKFKKPVRDTECIKYTVVLICSAFLCMSGPFRLQRLEAPVVGADIVECNPGRDVGGMTAMVGAKPLKEVVALRAGQRVQDMR